ncbi:MAG: transcriptional regulator [Winogradskyella sp.]|uniref:ArsR/SmtB family transcription factor n=1 Tax=Winogradskyella sp. TaxID=1883156 RepID=UPI000F3BFBE5|nr:metalloregulator ArsR/SmtB family transcription factor [Winogradskyella sp.]RNC87762.1 MAG: transcriptional regulator [Winogradskyella sp.]
MQSNINMLFKAIADPTRREIFHALVLTTSALSITQISTQFDMSRQGVTKHIKILNDAGLVKITEDGRNRFCFADPKPLKEVNKWMAFYSQYWDDSLDKLDDYLNTTKKA